MIGDKWWGYLQQSGFVTITKTDPARHSRIRLNGHHVVQIVGPFEESLEDVFEGDNKMVRRKIMAALDNQPLDEAVQRDSA